MNPNKLTIKSQEALQNAQEIASSYGNQVLEPEHLVAALIQDAGGTVVPLVQKIGANVDFIKLKLNDMLDKLPKVSGAGLGNQSISQNLARVLENAQKYVQNLKDEYVSTEHLLLAVVDGSQSEPGKLLREQGVTSDAVLKVLKEIKNV